MAKTIKKFNTLPKFLSRKERKKQNKVTNLLNTLDIEKIVLIMEEI